MYVAMAAAPKDNWRTQIRKGYLELCVLLLIRARKRIYGFDLLEQLAAEGLDVKEGTLYPLLSRMTVDGLLSAVWDTTNVKGHPRKFYSLTRDGQRAVLEMTTEFEEMVSVFRRFSGE
jgi:PadR family transcriptional regulator PadR